MPVACPSCGREIAIKDARPGRFRVACPGCAAPFRVEVVAGRSPEVIARPIEVSAPAAGETPAQAAERDLVARSRAWLSLRVGWAWKALTRRDSIAGGAVIVGEIGRTAHGVLARGRRLLTGRDVLVRWLPADRIGIDPIGRARFARTEYVCRAIEHLNLARRLDVGEVRGRFYTIEEDRGAVTLGARSARNDWSPALALPIVVHAARGLRTVHEQGLAHGDLGLDTIWIDPDGLVRLDAPGLAGLGDDTGLLKDRTEADVRTLGRTLRSLIGTPDSNAGRRSIAVAERMEAIGTPKGYVDLAETIRAIDDALAAGIPRPTEAATLAASARAWRNAPVARLRSRLIFAFYVLGTAFVLLSVRAGHPGAAIATAGFLSLTTAAYAVCLSISGGNGPGVLDALRELVFGGGRSDWLTVATVAALATVVVVAAGWFSGGLALAFVSAALALGFQLGLDAAVARERAGPISETWAILATIRGRGVDEAAVRDLAASELGRNLFTHLFGLREAAHRPWPGEALPSLRFAAYLWIEGRLLVREAERARTQLEPIEEAAQIAAKVNEMTARRRSRRIAEALVEVRSEVRATTLAALRPEVGAIRVVPRPIPDLIREAVETPDRLLSTTWSDDREPARGPNPLVRAASALVGPRARLLAGAVLVAGFCLWAEQVGMVSSGEIRDRARRAIATKDVGELSGVAIDLEAARLADESLTIPGVPPAVTRPIRGVGVGAAGLILLASSLIGGAGMALFAVLGAGIAWAGPTLGVPPVGPLSAVGLSVAIGLSLVAAGALTGRRR